MPNKRINVFHKDHIYPYLVDKLGDPQPIKQVRLQIIPLAQGKVLEIGAGTGANFPHYNSKRVSKLYALEPNLGMIRLAKRRKLQARLNIEFLNLVAEQIPLGTETVDMVVSTFTLCTIPDIVDALKGVRRILSPNG